MVLGYTFWVSPFITDIGIRKVSNKTPNFHQHSFCTNKYLNLHCENATELELGVYFTPLWGALSLINGDHPKGVTKHFIFKSELFHSMAPLLYNHRVLSKGKLLSRNFMTWDGQTLRLWCWLFVAFGSTCSQPWSQMRQLHNQYMYYSDMHHNVSVMYYSTFLLVKNGVGLV